MKTFTVLVAFSFLIPSALADMFLHNPPGSNNRLDAIKKTVQNENRLFDSQDNNNGGYNVAEGEKGEQFAMTYFMSGPTGKGNSTLSIEWTNQHGCGDDDQSCQIILQYMCTPDTSDTREEDKIRNGNENKTPDFKTGLPTSRDSKNKEKENNDRNKKRGLHEPFEWCSKCQARRRNEGLFTADQKLKGDSSAYTRQNPNGNRRGYECPEERDYFPYWLPTDWIDIAILTDKKEDCLYYKNESFNTKEKGECMEKYTDERTKTRFPNTPWKHFSKYNNKPECEDEGHTWVVFQNYLEKKEEYKSKEECEAATSEDIPLTWAIPYRSRDIDNLPPDLESMKECLVELHSLSCSEAPYSRPNHLGNGIKPEPLRYDWQLPYYPSGTQQTCVLRIRYNISTADPKSKLKNNPSVEFPKLGIPALKLKINTAQFGRTFQDRTHVFHLKSRESAKISENANIYNINVRGRRGNIVQVFPAVEYDFVPKRLKITEDDFVHIQMSGSNTNLKNNAGQGEAGTDRHNIVEMSKPSLSTPMLPDDKNYMFRKATLIWPTNKGIEDVELCMATNSYYKSDADVATKDELDPELDNANASSEGVVLKFAPGEYWYMCTRNNNFSNRSQKGRLVVKAVPRNKHIKLFSRHLKCR